MIRPIVFVSLLGMTACTGVQDAATDVARGQAKSVINGVVQSKFPGVNAAPITDCIVDNASLSEVFTLAKASVTGVTPETTQTVVDISTRPETTKCMLENSLKLL